MRCNKININIYQAVINNNATTSLYNQNRILVKIHYIGCVIKHTDELRVNRPQSAILLISISTKREGSAKALRGRRRELAQRPGRVYC